MEQKKLFGIVLMLSGVLQFIYYLRTIFFPMQSADLCYSPTTVCVVTIFDLADKAPIPNYAGVMGAGIMVSIFTMMMCFACGLLLIKTPKIKPVELVCAKCGTKNAPSQKFCGSCGGPLE